MNKKMNKISKNLSKGLSNFGKSASKGMAKTTVKGAQTLENFFMKPFKGMGEDLFAGKIYSKKKR